MSSILAAVSALATWTYYQKKWPMDCPESRDALDLLGLSKYGKCCQQGHFTN
jgi:hypothetical protein